MKGYQNVYRDPLGYPKWSSSGLPVAKLQLDTGLEDPEQKRKGSEDLLGFRMVWTLIGIFFGGMALNLTPCIYPLVPITISYFGGQAAQSEGGGQARLFMHGICYILGLALMNSMLGVTAALTGSLLGALLQNPIVLIGVASVLFLFATSLFGFWELKLPSALTQAAVKSYSGYLGSLFMGLTIGVVAAPCIGPFVLGLMTWVASMGSPWLGFVIFFTLSLGLGLPLFFLAVFSGQINRLPQSGEWMIWVRKLMGWVLTVMAVHFIRPLFSETVSISLYGGIFLAAGIHLGWLEKSRSDSRIFPLIRVVVALCCLVYTTFLAGSWYMQGPGVTWERYSNTILARAKQERKPVIIDFYATWCGPCRELDEITFHDKAIVKKASTQFVMIKVDLTKNSSPETSQLLQEYGVRGVPTVVFLDRDGNEKKDLRLVDFLPSDQFLSRMVQAEHQTE